MIMPSGVLGLDASSVFKIRQPEFTDNSVDISKSIYWEEVFDYFGIPPERKAIIFAFHGIQLEEVKNDESKQAELIGLDQQVMCGAEDTGGLIAYKSFKNPLPEKERDWVSICMWKDMAALKLGTSTEAHVEAVRRVAEFYESFRVACWEAGRQAVGAQVAFVKIYESEWSRPQSIVA